MSDKKKITIKEFKMWLQGVEEMQDAAWVPNPTQWQRIREKINDIEEVEVTQAPQISYPAASIPAYPPAGNVMPAVPAGPSSFAPPAMPQPSMMPSAPPAHGLFATPEAPNMPVRTPNIDTTNGQYQSSFA